MKKQKRLSILATALTVSALLAGCAGGGSGGQQSGGATPQDSGSTPQSNSSTPQSSGGASTPAATEKLVNTPIMAAQPRQGQSTR
jgi:branched-chain amino acid transport system substrate-binding protein